MDVRKLILDPCRFTDRRLKTAILLLLGNNIKKKKIIKILALKAVSGLSDHTLKTVFQTDFWLRLWKNRQLYGLFFFTEVLFHSTFFYIIPLKWDFALLAP